MKKAVLFGSIGVLAETSEIQRQGYNQALESAGLDWKWDRETYQDLLTAVGGKERLSLLSRATSHQLSADLIEEIHSQKTTFATNRVRDERPPLRDGVQALIALSKEQGIKLGLVTTTYRPNVEAIMAAHPTVLSEDTFDVIITRDKVSDGKPSPECYLTTLKQLGISPSEAIAIEDTAASVLSARRAGVEVIATPGEFAKDQDFFMADLVIPSLGSSSSVAESARLALGVN